MRGLTRARAVRLASSGVYRAGLAGALSMATGYLRRQPAFLILTYHRVNDEADPFFDSVPTAVFERQMAYVARWLRVLPVETLVDQMRRGRLTRNAVAVTFDDGYRDNLTCAAPILARYGLPATIFLATGFIGSGDAPWFDRLAMGFKTTRAGAVQAPWGELLALDGQTGRLRALRRALDCLKRVPDDQRLRWVERLLEALAPTDETYLKHLMLDWDEVRRLTALGFSVGAHTVTHPILSQMTEERARREIVESRAAIATMTGRSPACFAYPNGRPEDYTGAVRSLVETAGFTCAVTTGFGVNTRQTNVYELRRGGPWEHDVATFAVKLAAYRVGTG